MCRNIRQLYNFDPPATEEEVRAAAMQYIRKVTGVTRPTGDAAIAMAAAAEQVATVTAELLAELPSRRQPPKTVPPLRRPEVRKRMGLGPLHA
jgi:hypothetical protein